MLKIEADWYSTDSDLIEEDFNCGKEETKVT